jgi:hypothetical protein
LVETRRRSAADILDGFIFRWYWAWAVDVAFGGDN